MTPVALYRWELPDDLQPLRQAVARIAGDGCDVVLFTSSVQLDHLLTSRARWALKHEVRQALKERLVVGSIGPVMNDALTAEGSPGYRASSPQDVGPGESAAEQSAAVIASKAA